MIRKMFHLSIPVAVCVAAAATEAELVTSSFTSGRAQSTSSNCRVDIGLDPSGGAAAASESYILRPGYVGQLYDVVSLEATARQLAVSELETNQLEAVATMDDGSILPLGAMDVEWSIISGPIESVAAGGVAHTSAVFADALAIANGSYQSLGDDVSFTVLDMLPDNFDPVAGDGIEDGWQFQFFDADGNGSLDFSEAVDANPGSDPDGDGQDNQFESLAGYDPTDPLSFFTLSIGGKVGDTASLRLSKVIPGTRYQIQKSSDIGMADGFATCETLLPASEQVDVQVFDPNATDAQGYYRVWLDDAP